jgi:putative MATE family efflux protein
MDNTIQLMERMPLSKAIIKLALPTMLGMVVQSVYNMTDTFFIGMLGDPDLVAGVSIAMPLFFLTQGIGSLFAIGSASYISRKLGEKDYTEARRTNSVTIYSTLIIGAAMTTLMLIFKAPILDMIGASPDTFTYADDYFTIVCLFSIVMILNISMQGLVRSEGAATEAMLGMVVGLGLNIALDPLFIIYFGWGVKGAAWATIIGAAVSCLYYLRFFRSKKSFLSIHPRDAKPNKVMLSEIFKIGVPAGLTHIVMSAGGALSNIFAAGYGDHVVAATGINMRICSLAFMLVMGLAMGFQPFAGYNYGAGNYDRLKRGLKLTILYSSCISVVFTVLFLFAGHVLVRFFMDDEATVDAGVRILHAFVTGMPFLGIQMTMMTTFQALGKPIRALIVTLGRQCLAFIPLLFILNNAFGFDGYIFAQPMADNTTTVISVILGVTLFREMKKKSNALLQEQ